MKVCWPFFNLFITSWIRFAILTTNSFYYNFLENSYRILTNNGEIMIKIFLVLISFMLLSTPLPAQSETDYTPSTNVVPPSLEHYFFTRYGNLDISGNDGAFAHRIPVYKMSSGDINLDINLTYYSDGVKVNDIAGLVGMNWNLNAGGMVTRVVRGLPDEEDYTMFRPLKADMYYALNGSYSDEEYVSEHLDTYKKLYSANGLANTPTTIDMQQDLFNFNFNGYSGTFYLDKGKVHIAEHNGIKASYVMKYDAQQKRCLEFTFVTPDGVQYIFGGEEAFVESSRITNPCRKSYEKIPHSTWHIKRAIDTKGNIVDFKYIERSKSYPMDYYEYYSITGAANNLPGSVQSSYEQRCTVYFQAYDAKYLEEITFGSGKITFSYEGRSDYSTGYRLSSLQVVDTTGEVVMPVNFLYAYSGLQSGTGSAFKNRLFLLGVHLGNEQYSFAYNNMDGLPDRLSYQQDVYGYANANTQGTLTNFSLDGGNPATEFTSRFGERQANRSVDPVKSLYGLLTKITYPTQGYTEISYENNMTTGKENRRTSQGDLLVAEKHSCAPANALPSIRKYEFISNGEPLEFKSSMSVTRCPGVYVDDHHDVYSIKIRSITENKQIFTGSGRYDRFLKTAEEGDMADGIRIFSKIQTVENHRYEVELEVGTLFNNVYASLEIRHNFMTASVDVDVNYSGARVKRIRDYNGSSMENEKVYYYTDLPNRNGKKTSIRYDFVQSYKKCIPTVVEPADWGSISFTSFGCQTVCFGTTNYHDVFNQTDKRIKYRYVSKERNGSFVEEEFNVAEIIDDSQMLLPNPISTRNRSNNIWGQNVLLNTKYFVQKNNEQVLLREITNEYSPVHYERFDNYNTEPGIVPVMTEPLLHTSARYEGGADGCISLYCNVQGKVAINHYFNYVYNTKLTKRISVDYFENGEHARTETAYHYQGENHLQLTKSVTMDSKGEVLTTDYQYAPDLIGVEQTLLMQELSHANRIAEPVIVKRSNGTRVVHEVHHMYADFHGIIQKAATHEKNGDHIAPDTDVDRKITYDHYDTRGNLIQYRLSNDIPICILWGYGGQYPIASIENATYDEVLAILGQTTINNLKLSNVPEATITNAMNALRGGSSISKAQITSYTYKPLVGMTSKTDPRGVTEYYEYDGFQRLQEVLDFDKNVLQDYRYHYRP